MASRCVSDVTSDRPSHGDRQGEGGVERNAGVSSNVQGVASRPRPLGGSTSEATFWVAGSSGGPP